ncbi:Retinol-binding protein 2 [Galemys pyrenaicus]|uniref:Retinol-binding protein 2 n=1 Tax=Galemys pyrenaicus TaxID=202257 RepID=A0A8J6A3J5_GALPY|nr:Retinol-binding protein 2 [Galemys pyrenaicus]
MTRDQNGTWEMERNDNFEGYMKALDIDIATRKIAVHLSQTKIIEQDGDNFKTKTNSTFRNYELNFTVGVEFEEHTKGLDNRKIQSLVTWEGDVLVCVQKGEKANRGWKQWVEGDKLHLRRGVTPSRAARVFFRPGQVVNTWELHRSVMGVSVGPKDSDEPDQGDAQHGGQDGGGGRGTGLTCSEAAVICSSEEKQGQQNKEWRQGGRKTVSRAGGDQGCRKRTRM